MLSLNSSENAYIRFDHRQQVEIALSGTLSCSTIACNLTSKMPIGAFSAPNTASNMEATRVSTTVPRSQPMITSFNSSRTP